MNNIPTDVPKYKKKSTAKPPKKSKHKHIYEPCLIEAPMQWYLKPHERKRNEPTQLRFSSYCPVCGKTGDVDRERWWTKIEKDTGMFKYLESVYTIEGEREMDPLTRTLPVFKSDNPWTKFVDVGEPTDAGDE